MIEEKILSALVQDQTYMRKVLPFLKAEYFREEGEKVFLKIYQEYVNKYNKPPSLTAMAVELNGMGNLTQAQFEQTRDLIVNAAKDPADVDYSWLLDKTEEFCQDRALYNAIMDSIKLVDSPDAKVSKGNIPKMLQDALAVSFDTKLGHEFIEDAERRFDFYHAIEERVAFSIDILNEVTGGGVPRKTLNVILAGTNVGKSLAMCSMAADNLVQGKNVLYITMEMAEERIMQRIDANLLDVTMDDLMALPRDAYMKKIARVRDKTVGKLFVKEFPTAGAHAGHFRHLLHELKTKKNFVPDVIYIDYLNICASQRIRANSNANSYTIVKSIAEELRGLAIEFNVPIWTATQTNRTGFSNSDPDLTDTSESFGLPMTADFFIALVTNEQLAAANQFMVIQLKSRYGDANRKKRFLIGVDRAKMRLFNLDEAAQKNVVQEPFAASSNERPQRSTSRHMEFDMS